MSHPTRGSCGRRGLCFARRRHGTKCPRLQCAPRAEPNGEIKAQPVRTDTHGLGAQRPQGGLRRQRSSRLFPHARGTGVTGAPPACTAQTTAVHRPALSGAACKGTNTHTRIHKRAHQCRARNNNAGRCGYCSRGGQRQPCGAHSPSHTRTHTSRQPAPQSPGLCNGHGSHHIICARKH